MSVARPPVFIFGSFLAEHRTVLVWSPRRTGLLRRPDRSAPEVRARRGRLTPLGGHRCVIARPRRVRVRRPLTPVRTHADSRPLGHRFDRARRRRGVEDPPARRSPDRRYERWGCRCRMRRCGASAARSSRLGVATILVGGVVLAAAVAACYLLFAAVAWRLRNGEVGCGCFGAASSTPPGPLHIAVNLLGRRRCNRCRGVRRAGARPGVGRVTGLRRSRTSS